MGKYSIKDLELLTGIKAHTLRIWEQRYNMPIPKRTETNIRFYDDDDLKLMLNVSLLNQNGHKISEITKLTVKEISELALIHSIQSKNNSAHIQTMISAMIDLDEIAFEKMLSTCILQSGIEHTMMEVIFPLLNSVGMMWQTGAVDPAYEHFVSNLIRQKLIVAIEGQTINRNSDVKKFLLFLPENEHHELGLLFANFMIRKSNQHSLYLGQNVPLNDVYKVGKRYNPDIILTSMTSTFTHDYANQLLVDLKNHFPNSRILTTGRFFSINKAKLSSEMELVAQPQDLSKFF